MVEKFLWLQNHFLQNIFPPKLFIKGISLGPLWVAHAIYFGSTSRPTIRGMGEPLYVVTETNLCGTGGPHLVAWKSQI